MVREARSSEMNPARARDKRVPQGHQAQTSPAGGVELLAPRVDSGKADKEHCERKDDYECDGCEVKPAVAGNEIDHGRLIPAGHTCQPFEPHSVRA